jgi:hypothetical protein
VEAEKGGSKGNGRGFYHTQVAISAGFGTDPREWVEAVKGDQPPSKGGRKMSKDAPFAKPPPPKGMPRSHEVDHLGGKKGGYGLEQWMRKGFLVDKKGQKPPPPSKGPFGSDPNAPVYSKGGRRSMLLEGAHEMPPPMAPPPPSGSHMPPPPPRVHHRELKGLAAHGVLRRVR